jgi:GNAT superfamily N-acetyltransferase
VEQAAQINELVIRQLTEADIPFAMELKNIAGWNQVEADWQGYLAYEPEGCFLAEINGRPAGTATAIRYGTSLGWIGMVLVHPDLRRYGIGKALLNRTIGYLQDIGVTCIKLDATPMGKTVYVPLGFVDEYELERYQGVAGKLPDEEASSGTLSKTTLPVKQLTQADVIPITEELMAELIAFDAQYFGVLRSEVLSKLTLRDNRYGLCIQQDGHMLGYLLAHQGYNAVQAGPWIASSEQAAEVLFKAFMCEAVGKNILLDMPCLNDFGKALLLKHGFTVQRGFTRMYLGENRCPGHPQGIYGTSGAEKG